MPSSISKLTGLLKECGVSPSIATDNIVPNISYDCEYRVVILAIVFGELAKAEGSTKKIRYHHLGLYQFVLLHPHLLKSLSDWATEYHHRSHNPLEEIWVFPNSFSSDTVFKDIYTYFIIFGQIQQVDDYATIDRTKNPYFFDIYDQIVSGNLFRNVIDIAKLLREIRIQKGAGEMRLIKAGVQGISEVGKFSGTFEFSDGLSVITGPNRYGKSLVFSAIVWCLGVEHIFGVLADDSSIFSNAAKSKFKYMNGDQEVEASVLDSWAFLELNNAEGKKVTLIRSITRDKNHIHWVDEEKDVILATGSGSFLNETSGFQHYLFQFLGLEKRFLMSNRGKEAGIYFENLAPLFLIEQLGGWSDIQSEQTMRYGTRDINEGAFELLLGNSELLAQRLNAQNHDALQSGLKAEAKSIASDFTILANSYGWDYELPNQGTVKSIRERLSTIDLSNEIKHLYSIDAKRLIAGTEARIQFLRERLSSDTDSNNPNKALTDSINRSIELKTAKLDHEELISKLQRQLNEHERTLRSIEYQIESANDLIKFQRDGVGHLTSAPCPTCHQIVEPSQVGSTDDFGTLVMVQKEQLERDRHIIGANIYRTGNELKAALARLNSVSESLELARREMSILQQLSSPEKEALLKISYDLIAAEKDLAKAIKLGQEIERIQALITDWVGRAEVADNGQRIEPLGTDEVKDFLNHLRNYVVQTGCAGVGSGDGAHVTLDEYYRPILRDRLLRSYGSASDRARLVIAYCLALLMSGKSHPGFLVFDEPLQQNPDPHHREKFLSFLKTFSKLKKQVVIFTSIKLDEIQDLQKGGTQVKQVLGDHFLKLIPMPQAK